MKTRQEMVYDFMLALCADLGAIRDATESAEEGVELLYTYAGILADRYLKDLG
jgi:hypothetical protein